MQCHEFEQRCQELLDRRQALRDDAALRAHALTCEHCDEELRIQSLLYGEIERSKTSPRRGGSASVMGSNKTANPLGTFARSDRRTVVSCPTEPGQSWSTTKSVCIGLALAGSLLVMIAPALRHGIDRLSDRGNSQRNGIGLAIRPRITPRIAPRAATVAVTTPARNRSRAPAATLPIPSPATSDQETFRKLVQGMADKWSEVPDEQLEPLDRIAGGFRPLANTLGAAWDALRRTIPVRRAPSIQEPQAVFGWPGYPASPA